MSGIDKYYNVRIKLRTDSWTHWLSKNTFIPYEGEVIIYNALNEEEALKLGMKPITYQQIKIGDGATPLKDLPFINDLSALSLDIKTSELLGAINFAGKDIYVKGLEVENHSTIMCFQPIDQYYSKTTIENKINAVKDFVDSKIQAEQDSRKEQYENLIDDNNEFKNEITKNIDDLELLIENLEKTDTSIESRIQNVASKLETLTGDANVSIKELQDNLNIELEQLKNSDSLLAQNIINAENNSKISIQPSNQTIYTLFQGNNKIGEIDVGKDSHLINGELVMLENQIKLNLEVSNQKDISIDLSPLKDIYTTATNAQTIQLFIDNNKISAAVMPNSITGSEIKYNTITKEHLTDALRQEIQNSGNGSGGGVTQEQLDKIKEYVDVQLSTPSGVAEGFYGPQKNQEYKTSIPVPQLFISETGKILQAETIDLALPNNKIILNGIATEQPSFYAPQEPGEKGMILISDGDYQEPPKWSKMDVNLLTQTDEEYLILDCIQVGE